MSHAGDTHALRQCEVVVGVHLVDLIADDAPSDARSQLAHNAASDAADMLLLMTLENTADAAEDAVHLMLQVKREFDMAARRSPPDNLHCPLRQWPDQNPELNTILTKFALTFNGNDPVTICGCKR